MLWYHKKRSILFSLSADPRAWLLESSHGPLTGRTLTCPIGQTTQALIELNNPHFNTDFTWILCYTRLLQSNQASAQGCTAFSVEDTRTV